MGDCEWNIWDTGSSGAKLTLFLYRSSSCLLLREAEKELRAIITGKKPSAEPEHSGKLSFKDRAWLLWVWVPTLLLLKGLSILITTFSQLKQNFTHCTDSLLFSKPRNHCSPHSFPWLKWSTENLSLYSPSARECFSAETSRRSIALSLRKWNGLFTMKVSWGKYPQFCPQLAAGKALFSRAFQNWLLCS